MNKSPADNWFFFRPILIPNSMNSTISSTNLNDNWNERVFPWSKIIKHHLFVLILFFFISKVFFRFDKTDGNLRTMSNEYWISRRHSNQQLPINEQNTNDWTNSRWVNFIEINSLVGAFSFVSNKNETFSYCVQLIRPSINLILFIVVFLFLFRRCFLFIHEYWTNESTLD